MLPLRAMHGWCNLCSSYLVLGAIGCPVRVFGRDHVRAGFGIVEGRVHNTWLYALSDRRFQRRVALATGKRYQVTLVDAANSRNRVSIPRRVAGEYDSGVYLASGHHYVLATLGNSDIGRHVPALHVPDKGAAGAVALP